MVKIADFGLARFNDLSDLEDEASQLTMTGATLGTPMYCAPEQFTGDPVDHRADIYGLGATLFSMLSGVAPFEVMKLPKLVAAKVTGGVTAVRPVAGRRSAGISPTRLGHDAIRSERADWRLPDAHATDR